MQTEPQFQVLCAHLLRGRQRRPQDMALRVFDATPRGVDDPAVLRGQSQLADAVFPFEWCAEKQVGHDPLEIVADSLPDGEVVRVVPEAIRLLGRRPTRLLDDPADAGRVAQGSTIHIIRRFARQDVPDGAAHQPQRATVGGKRTEDRSKCHVAQTWHRLGPQLPEELLHVAHPGLFELGNLCVPHTGAESRLHSAEAAEVRFFFLPRQHRSEFFLAAEIVR
mmetsp:Transcript_8244/g.24452  ORF Transcript_8244/g.24452 Transcript_8244/m.24452 type:complete len:222 (-) Transcript_8244:735-1400(-)